jgi:hypothetical protein
MITDIIPILFIMAICGSVIFVIVYALMRFVRAHERVASALENIARKQQDDGKL